MWRRGRWMIPAKHKLQFAADDRAERQITEVLKWVIASKLFDY